MTHPHWRPGSREYPIAPSRKRSVFHRANTWPLISLASLDMESGLHSRAERLLRPWLRNHTDSTDPLSLNLLHIFAGLQHVRGKYGEAELLYRRTLASAETAFGTQSQEVAFVLNNLSMLLVQTGRKQDVAPLLTRALAIWENILTPNAILLRQTKQKESAKALESRARGILNNLAAGQLGRHSIEFRDLLTSPQP